MKLLSIVLALLAVPAAAHAAPLPLGPADHARLSGDDAVLSRAVGDRVGVASTPLSGGPAAGLFRYDAPDGQTASAELDASAERAGVVVTTTNRRGFLLSAQAFLGATSGPLDSVGPAVPFEEFSVTPTSFAITGETSILEYDDGGRVVINADGTQAPVDLPAEISAVDFEGDLVAYGARRGGETEEDPPTQLVVANWRTGETIRTDNLERGIMTLGLRADGAVIMEVDGGPLQVALPGEAVRTIVGAGTSPVRAGDRVVVTRGRLQGYKELQVNDLDGGVTQFGVPSAQISDVTADAGTVVWVANGCALTAPIDDGAAPVAGAGPCPRNEALVATVAARLRHHRLRPRVRCLAAATACTGRVTSKKTRPAPFEIAQGTGQRVVLRLKKGVRLESPGTLTLRVAVRGGRAFEHTLSVVK